MRNYTHISATIDKELLKRVSNFCAAEERSKSWVISKAIEKLLEEIESVFSTAEWEKIEKLANQKGRRFSSGKHVKQYLAKL